MQFRIKKEIQAPEERHRESRRPPGPPEPIQK